LEVIMDKNIVIDEQVDLILRCTEKMIGGIPNGTKTCPCSLELLC